jgi:hypothetical protein
VSQPEHIDPGADTDTLAALFSRLLHKAQGDPELAELLRQLAATALTALPVATPEPSGVQAVADPVAPEPPIELASDDDVQRLLSTFASRTREPDALPDLRGDIDLKLVPERLRLKARACRWLGEHGFTADELALGQRYALIDEGKQADCYLWMLNPYDVSPHASRGLDLLAENYEATATILEFWLNLEGHTLETDVARLLAEAQSALRAAVTNVRSDPSGAFPWLDDDQRGVFQELRRYSSERGVYLEHLSLRAECNPSDGAGRLAQLAALQQQFATEKEQTKGKEAAFGQLKYHANRLNDRPHQPEHDWKRVADAVDRLLTAGVPESDVNLRRLLAPVAGLFPDNLPHPQVSRILESLATTERVKAERSARQPVRTEEPVAAEVAEVARLVGGRTIIVIGGKPNQEAVAQIETALSCKVEWVRSKEHASPSTFKPAIIRNEVILVLLLIRWSSHVFSEVEAFCDSHGKHLVRVPSGYNVKKLAMVILEQAGNKLRAKA